MADPQLQAAGGKKKKKKAVKMNLNDFLADTSTGTNWADEMDELPSAQASAAAALGDTGDDRRGFGSGFSRDAAPRGPQVLPTKPPFTAYVGNLPYEDLSDESLTEFFVGCSVKHVRIIRDFNEQPKGFGYVEFEDVSSLEKAIGLSGSPLGGRNLRINIAEQAKSGFGDRGSAPERSDIDQWRRSDSGSSSDLPRSGSGGGFGRRDSSFSDLNRADSSGGWRRATDLPSKGDPTPPGSARSPRFGFRRHDDDGSQVNDSSDWRKDRPASRSPSMGRDISRTQSGSMMERGGAGRTGGSFSHRGSDTSWGGGAFTPRPAARSPSRDMGSRDRSWDRPGHAKDTSWGGGAFTPRGRRDDRSTDRSHSRDTSWAGGAFTPHSPRTSTAPSRREGSEVDEDRGRTSHRTKDTEWSGGAFAGKESFDHRRSSVKEENRPDHHDNADESPKGKSETEPSWRRPVVEEEEEEEEEESEEKVREEKVKKEPKKTKSDTESTWRRPAEEKKEGEEEEGEEKVREEKVKKEPKKTKSDTESTWRRPAEEKKEGEEEEVKEEGEEEVKKEKGPRKEDQLMSKDTWRSSGTPASPTKASAEDDKKKKKRDPSSSRDNAWSGGAFSRSSPPEDKESTSEEKPSPSSSTPKNVKSSSAWGRKSNNQGAPDRTMADKWERGVALPSTSSPPAPAQKPERKEDRASRSEWGKNSSPRPEGNVWEQRSKAATSSSSSSSPSKEDKTMGNWGKARAEAQSRTDEEAPAPPKERNEKSSPSKADTEDTWRVVTRKK
ncbi:MAG: hypothetical protein DHS80DRAFT_29957 [Piptocephalis tieghemiana]|nr:MAG: hypothetical protein DHS80DRAFT_29957 [Piptocephalis tieghemiana]